MTAAAFSRPQTPRAMVQVDKLWSVFGEGDNAFAVHQDLDLTVYQGDMLSIVGGSGTGKTVLLRQILGLLQPGRGTVTTPAMSDSDDSNCEAESNRLPSAQRCGPSSRSRSATARAPSGSSDSSVSTK